MIRADGVDILVDLAGHTAGSRVWAMAARPAPVQVTYLGYPNTTGLKYVDYRIVDSVTDPVGAERLATEKLVRVDPCFLCYRPPGDAPEPVVRSGGFTVGSFNTVAKLSVAAMDLWARVLREVEGSRLVLKSHALDDAGTAERFLAGFVERGVERGRVELLARTKGRREH